jgi:hypothetical protein
MSDQDVANRAKAHGANYSLRIIIEAKRAGLPVSLGFALVERESGFRNVYGHDPVTNRAPKGAKVTRTNYLHVYLPDRRAGKGMQGVGPCQLTWYAKQDRADRLGGCWIARYNIRVAFEDLAALIHSHGIRAGIKAYNGNGPGADRYAVAVLACQRRWHNILK